MSGAHPPVVEVLLDRTALGVSELREDTLAPGVLKPPYGTRAGAVHGGRVPSGECEAPVGGAR